MRAGQRVAESGRPRSGRRRLRRRTRRRVRRALLVCLVVGSVLLGAAGWVGFRGWQARAHLVNAAGLARELSTQVVGGDLDRARRTLAALQEQAGAARTATGDPGWQLARHTPYAGDDVAAVRTIAVAIDDLAREAFPALLRTDLTTLVPTEGRLDLARLRAASADLTAADAAVRRSRAGLDAVPAEDLVSQLGTALTELRAEIDRLAGLTGAADRGARVLPALLGADGPRTYLLLSQNLAELRATGGMFGAYAVIHADDGRIRMREQGTSAQFGRFTPALRVDDEVRRLYTDLPGIYPADVNLSPNFPAAAKLYREMYRRHSGVTVDGVLTVDPVMLSYLLQATGPVQVPGDATLVSTQVVRTLLSDAYQGRDDTGQDAFFAASASAVFDAFLTKKVNPRVLLSALDRSITERRILFWSARSTEQRTFADTRLAGALPEQESTPTVGVFLNDGSGAKLGYYLRPTAILTAGDCADEGRRQLKLRFTLHSSAPDSGLAKSVLGLGMAGDPYTARTLISIYSPAGGTVLSARVDGKPTSLGSGIERRRQVVIATVDVAPGATRTLDVDLLTGRNTTGTPELWHTPTATPWTTQVVPAPSCKQ
ncbi:DUF4012 domain-containing protein [Micromonospora sp. WMMD734]|uniref:DUF4012 domain-containing protein n=1 Tax=unclassified Micromonospora TaxID=2617518 RepID=UPI00248F6B50|nr:DUF4012 domain-containing protein [Micromonospora sp. AKA109]